MAVNRFAYLFAGAVLGAAGMAMAKTEKGQEIISGVINGGCGVAENLLARVETMKEDIEDYMAEVNYKKAEAAKAAGEVTEAADGIADEADAVIVTETVFEPEEETLADVEIELEVVSDSEMTTEIDSEEESDLEKK